MDAAAFEELCRSEARYRALAETTSDFIWETDASGRYTFCSPQMETLWGIRPEDMLGKTPFDAMPESERPRALQLFRELAQRGRAFRGLRSPAYDAAGRLIHLEISGVPFFADDGTLLGFRGLSRDVTEQRRMEAESEQLLGALRQEKERLTRLLASMAGIARIFREALSCDTEEELGRACLAVAEEMTRSACGFIAEVNEATGTLDHIAASDLRGDPLGPGVGRHADGETPAGFEVGGLFETVLTGGRGVFTNEPASEPDAIPAWRALPDLRAFLGVPLIAGEKTIGILALANREGGYRAEDLEVAEALAPAIVQALLRTRVEQELRNTTRRFQTIVDHAPVAIYVKDRQGRFVFGNRQLEKITGRPLETLLGKTDYDVAPREDAHRWRENDLRILAAQGASEFEETGTDAAGRAYVNLSVKFPLRDDAGTAVAVCGISTDITDRKRDQKALQDSARRERERAAELREANEALARADRRKDEFIAILSHELRNPLAPIRYALPLLSEERLGEGGRRAVAVIDRQVANLTRLVDDLLDVSRITTGKIDLRMEEVTLAAVLAAAVEAASPAIAAARHSLDVSVPDAPIWLNGDAARLSQAVTNLLNNSAKYTPKGGRIRLEATADEGQVVIRVVDNGIGIAAESLTAVFEMFHQGGRVHQSQGGLGIGLSLTKQLVEMHGGSIEARSGGENKGAQFVIRLPEASAARGRDRQQPASAQGRPACLRVLVVDDNVDLVDMLSMVVETAGHEVRKAFDGPSAISAALDYRPHVILLDVGMPGMDGIAVAKELRHQPSMAGVHIVALTGWGQPEDRRRTAEARFDDHLTKPADPQQIHRVLDEVARRVSV